jgi:DNA polymerase-3 subunit delta
MAKRGSTKPSAAELTAEQLGPGVRILVLAGKEPFLRQGYTDVLKQAIADAGETPEVVRFDGADHEPADVFDECRSFSLMGGYKIVVVDNADQLVANERRPLAERYAQSPTEGVTLVLRTDSWNKGKKLDEPIRACGGFMSCDELRPGKAAGWAIRRAERLGVSLEEAAALLLIDRVGVGLVNLASEVDKLVATVGAGEAVTVDAVRELVGRSREEEVWSIQEPLLRGDAEASIGKLNELLSVGAGAPIQLIRWAYADLARKLHLASRGVAEGAPPRQAAKAAGMWGAGLEPLVEAAGRVDERRAAALLREAVETDFRGKSGTGDEKAELEALSVRFCDTLRAGAAVR